MVSADRMALFLRTAMEVLRDAGGSLARREVMAAVAERVITFTAEEIDLVSSGHARWQKRLGWKVDEAKAIGWTSKAAGWSITKEGLQALIEYPETELYEELSRRYHGRTQSRSPDNSATTQLALDVTASQPPAVQPRAEAMNPLSTILGGHRRSLVRVRRGQSEFRAALLRVYGPSCAVTGPCPAEALEAAHLRAFADHGRHRVEEGLLLRADIHSLFDDGLLTVDPDTLEVLVDPRLAAYADYVSRIGQQLKIPSNAPLDRNALRDHRQAARGQ